MSEMTPLADPPGPILNMEGPGNETLFYRFLTWCLPAEWKSTVQAEVDESFSHLASEDDRAVALVGALLIENAVNALLSAYVPGYKNLEKNRDFSLSLKIELAGAEAVSFLVAWSGRQCASHKK